MKYSEWNNIRARLHHDWLKNRYLIFLMARAEYLDNIIESHKDIREDIIEQFVELQNRVVDFEALIDGTVDSLSPAQLLDEYPLDRMSEENRKWLSEVVHALYCDRTGIKKKIAEIKKKFNSVQDMYLLLAKLLKGKNGGLLEKAGKQPFMKFRFEIQEFSIMLSSLPHQVQIV